MTTSKDKTYKVGERTFSIGDMVVAINKKDKTIRFGYLHKVTEKTHQLKKKVDGKTKYLEAKPETNYWIYPKELGTLTSLTKEEFKKSGYVDIISQEDGNKVLEEIIGDDAKEPHQPKEENPLDDFFAKAAKATTIEEFEKARNGLSIVHKKHGKVEFTKVGPSAANPKQLAVFFKKEDGAQGGVMLNLLGRFFTQ